MYLWSALTRGVGRKDSSSSDGDNGGDSPHDKRSKIPPAGDDEMKGNDHDDDDDDDVQEMKACDICRKFVSVRNYQLHHAHCQRHPHSPSVSTSQPADLNALSGHSVPPTAAPAGRGRRRPDVHQHTDRSSNNPRQRQTAAPRNNSRPATQPAYTSRRQPAPYSYTSSRLPSRSDTLSSDNVSRYSPSSTRRTGSDGEATRRRARQRSQRNFVSATSTSEDPQIELVLCKKCRKNIPRHEMADHRLAHELEAENDEETSVSDPFTPSRQHDSTTSSSTQERRRPSQPSSSSSFQLSIGLGPWRYTYVSSSSGSSSGSSSDSTATPTGDCFSVAGNRPFPGSLFDPFDFRHTGTPMAGSRPMAGLPQPLFELLRGIGSAGIPMAFELDSDDLGQRGMDSDMINSLPTQKFDTSRREQLNDESRQCLICLEDFKDGEEQRWLPCLHTFHTACVDRWLAASTLCPICKVDIEEAMTRGNRSQS